MIAFGPELWKKVAHHQRHLRRLAEQHEIILKRRIWAEHEKRVALVNAMTILLPKIVAHDNPYWCVGCQRPLAKWGHRPDCPYMAALAAVAEAGRSVDV